MGLRTIGAALAGVVLLAGGATAQEDWTGFYAGAFAGYAWGELQSSPGHRATTGDYDEDSALAGIFGGYRRQLDSDVVIGGELNVPLYFEKGTAVDKQYYPNQVFYEAEPEWGVNFEAQVGRAIGRLLPYGYASFGWTEVEGRTLNVDTNDNLSPGFVQSKSATHEVYQIGGGLDVQVTDNFVVGGRLGYFTSSEEDYTMPWNVPPPNDFGYDAWVFQARVAWRFGG